MTTLTERVQQLKEKWPAYTEILQFYEQVRAAQLAAKESLVIQPVKTAEQWAVHLAEGLSMIRKEDFIVDIVSSTELFHTLCRIGKTTTPLMANQIDKISGLLADKRLHLEKILTAGADDQSTEKLAVDLGLEPKILSFLITNSIRPSVESGAEHFRNKIASTRWHHNRCPVCSSPPALNLLKDQGGKRYSLCSYCACQWRIERLSCAVCGNTEQDKLSYFCGEDEEAHRIDLCDVCDYYIKTIDYRTLEDSDPFLEDLATLHLDVLAADKGYQKLMPSCWNI